VELVVGEDVEGAVVGGILRLGDGHREVVSDVYRPAAIVRSMCVYKQDGQAGKVYEVALDTL